ncbi:MAG: type II toxin-antitoxin system VapC family toxin [Candidatus Aenigmarchaeota archaeon]|nr:type II toxin-antitoxin system VapC family toxin [Candidatus Aenigmarchaeota archaeon]
MPVSGQFPKHHIDTSVIIEPENTEDGRFCKRYLQKLNYNYTGILSFPVLSEIFVILNSLEDFNERYDFIEPLLAMVKSRNIEFYAPKDIGNLLNSIKSTEKRIGFVDSEIVACAAEDKADALITLDRDLINNKNLEKLLRIRILHPKDLL